MPGTVRLLAPDHPRQATTSMGGASDDIALVIDSAPFWSSEALEAVSRGRTTIRPPWGNSPVISTADRPSALRSSSSHTRRIMIRNSRRPYPPIQPLAQRWEVERLAFAPRQGEGSPSTSGHHQSNEMISVASTSKQLALRRESLPSGAGADSEIYEQDIAGNPSSVIGPIEGACLLDAPRAVGPSVIATSHWSTIPQSNSELQAFPCHISSLPQSGQCDPPTITFHFTQTAPSRHQLPHRSSVYDLAMPLPDPVGHEDLQSMSHIQQSLFFQLDPQLRPSPIGLPVVSFYEMASSESGTDHPYHPMSRVAHASTMSQYCFNIDPLEHGANGSTSASRYI
jgi:hypothetical protein